jgi:hypothetical protein
VIRNTAGENVSSFFKAVKKVDGKLTVTAKEVTIKTGSAKKEYDGKPLTKDEATITGLVGGEKATVIATGSQTDVGSSKNTYEITWGIVNKDNYIVKEDIGTLVVTKNNSEIIAGARKVITGINVAQYLMVEPIITELLEVLPKPIAKETFEKICLDIGTNIERFYEPGEANNVLETAVHHNREILRKLGIPERNFHKYGAEWPEEVYTISKGAGK